MDCFIYALFLCLFLREINAQYEAFLDGSRRGWDRSKQNHPEWPNQFEPARDVLTTVDTTKGKVTGTIVRLYDGPGTEWDQRYFKLQKDARWQPWMNVTVFLGIPYAEPPVGNLRFRPPREIAAWRPKTVGHFVYMPVCPQPKDLMKVVENNFRMSEDCLYLNVFTPNITELKYPVMVFIHGGGYYWGASDMFPGHMLAASQGVVVVTLNYRLGPLGFLSTGDIHSPGNYGLLDQRMAIEWVKNNIENFAGDKNRITIFGQSAGGASVGLHTLSHRSKGNFRSAIAQSGSEMAKWAVIEHWEHAWNNSKKYGEIVGCPVYNSERLVECLRVKSDVELGDSAAYTPDIGLFGWAPVVDIPQFRGILPPDNQFLPNKPEVLIRNGGYDPRMAYMAGVTEGEGYGFLLRKLPNSPNLEVSSQDMDTAIMDLLKTENYTQNTVSVADSVRFMYTYWQDPRNKTMRRKEFVNMFSDFYYKSPAHKSINMRAELGAPVYQYVFNWSRENEQKPESPGYKYGFVPHMDDLYYIFGFPFLDNPRQNEHPSIIPKSLQKQDWLQGDRNVSAMIMQLWANFAKLDNPTPTRVFNTTWEKYTLQRDSYLVINQTNTSYIYHGYRPLQSAFWSEYLPMAYFPTTMAPWPTETPIEMERRRYMIATWTSVTLGVIILLALFGMCALYVKQSKKRSHFGY